MPLDQPQRVADEIAAFVDARAERKRASCAFFFATVHVFRLTEGPCFRERPLQDGEPCPRRSSTRTGPGARWRGASTKRSRAATSGPLAPPSQRRSETVFSPLALELLEDERQRRRGAHPGAARAVVVGVVQEDDVAGAGAGASSDARSTRRSRAAFQSLPQRDQSTGRQPRPRTARRPDGAEDPVGRAVVGDRLAASPPRSPPGPARRRRETAPRAEPQLVAVAVAVQLDPVAGGDDLGRQRRPLARPARRRGRRSPWRRPRAGSRAPRGVPCGCGPSSKVSATPRAPSWRSGPRAPSPSAGHDRRQRRAGVQRPAAAAAPAPSSAPIKAPASLASDSASTGGRRLRALRPPAPASLRPCRSGCGSRSAWRSSR